MPRDSGGNYSLPAGNPVVSGTTIDSSWANNTLPDLGTEVQSSLDRSGRGAMLAALKAYVGTVGAPGVTFSGDTDNGLYWIGANEWGVTTGGNNVIIFKDNLIKLRDGSASAPTLVFQTDPDSGFYQVGDGIVGLAIAGAELARFASNLMQMQGTAPKLRFYDNNGSANQRKFEFQISANNIKLVSLQDDDATVSATLFSFNHDGTTSIPGLPTGITNKFNATTAPTANDDSGDGYSVGSAWADVTNDRWYVCVDATGSAAVWLELPKKTEAHTWSSLQTFTSGITANGTATLNSDVVLTGNVSVTDHTDTSSSNSITFDFDEGNILECSLTENITSITLSNLNANGVYEIWITQHASSGPFTVSGWAGVTWVGGSAPTMNTTASDLTAIQLRKNGAIILGTALNAG